MLEEIGYLQYLIAGGVFTYLTLDTRLYTWWQYLIIGAVYIFPPNIQHYFNVKQYIQKAASISIGLLVLQLILPRFFSYFISIIFFVILKAYTFSNTLDPNYTINLTFFHYGVTLCLVFLNTLTKPMVISLIIYNIGSTLVSNLVWSKRRVVGFTEYK